MTDAIKFLRRNGCDPATMDFPTWMRQRIDDKIDIARYAEETISKIHLRDEYIKKFGFAILTPQAIDFIRPYAPLVEIGSGSGYWAYELRRAKINVIATDLRKGPHAFHWSKRWTKVERRGAVSAAKLYPGRTLLVVWPDYKAPWTGNALAAYQGKIVIYVGEGIGGCTGDDRFHRILYEQFEHEATHQIPQFYGIHDRLEVWRRKM